VGHVSTLKTRLSPFGSAGLATVVTLIAVASCGGIQERVEKLRAQHVEIVDEHDQVKMDVEKDVRALTERVTKLEAELAKLREAPPAAPPPALGAPTAPIAPAPKSASSSGPSLGF
jgi:hypothetical protein